MCAVAYVYFLSLSPPFPVPRGNAQEDTQKAVKRIQLLMATLPDSKRPKTILELKEFVQQYSSLINKGGNFLSNYQATPPSTSTSSSMGANSSPLPSNSSSSERTRTQVARASIDLPAQERAPAPMGPTTIALPVRSGMMEVASEASPTAGGLTLNRLPVSVPSATYNMASLFLTSEAGVSKHQSSSSCTDTPVTTHSQFKGPGISMSAVPFIMAETMLPQPAFGRKPSPSPIVPTSSLTSQSAVPSSTSKTGIQAGVAMPLPAGVTLETLGVLCRLPESDLLKLNLPMPLLSAIKVWKARQGPGKSKVCAYVCICSTCVTGWLVES